MDVNKIVGTMFFLILVFLLLSRAGEFNLIIGTLSNFVTRQTEALQGRGSQPVVAGTAATASSIGSNIGSNIGSIFGGGI